MLNLHINCCLTLDTKVGTLTKSAGPWLNALRISSYAHEQHESSRAERSSSSKFWKFYASARSPIAAQSSADSIPSPGPKLTYCCCRWLRYANVGTLFNLRRPKIAPGLLRAPRELFVCRCSYISWFYQRTKPAAFIFDASSAFLEFCPGNHLNFNLVLALRLCYLSLYISKQSNSRGACEITWGSVINV